jgi:hypothetical protein
MRVSQVWQICSDPYPAEEMASRSVSKRVSNPDNEGPELIEVDNAAPELWGYVPQAPERHFNKAESDMGTRIPKCRFRVA